MADALAKVSVDAIIEEHGSAGVELIEAVGGLSAEERNAVWFGERSLCDIVAHLAGAQEGYAEWLEHVARGEPPKITGWEEPGPPLDFNRITVEARRGREWQLLMADLDVARSRHEAAIRALPAERYEASQDGYPNEFSPWPNEVSHFAAKHRPPRARAHCGNRRAAARRPRPVVSADLDRLMDRHGLSAGCSSPPYTSGRRIEATRSTGTASGR